MTTTNEFIELLEIEIEDYWSRNPLPKTLRRFHEIQGEESLLESWEKKIWYFHNNPITADFIKEAMLYTMKPLILGDSKGMSAEEFTAMRQDPKLGPISIGGSDGGTILGNNAFKTSLDLMAEKRKQVPVYTDEFNQDILQSGHDTEAYIKANFHQKFPELNEYEVVDDTHIYQHPYLPWIRLNVDGILQSPTERVLLECKSIDSANFEGIKSIKGGHTRPSYEVQMRLYMSGLSLSKAICTWAWGFRRSQMATTELTREAWIEADILNHVNHFVYVYWFDLPHEPVAASARALIEAINRWYGFGDPAKTVTLDSSLEKACKAWIEIRGKRKTMTSEHNAIVKEMEKQEDVCIAQIRKHMLGDGIGLVKNKDGSYYRIKAYTKFKKSTDIKKLDELIKSGRKDLEELRTLKGSETFEIEKLEATGSIDDI